MNDQQINLILENQRRHAEWYKVQAEWLKAIEKNTAQAANAVRFMAGFYVLAMLGVLLSLCS